MLKEPETMQKVAVLIPCYNEAMTIAKVVADFRQELPQADIYVYDNNSSDGSDGIARKAGAAVRYVSQQGKGNVVRRMFREVEADVFVMVDGDDTYPANEVHKLIDPIADGRADMVNGDRLSSTYYEENKRPGHNFGNALVCSLVKCLWRRKINDVMTGYRAFSRFFVKTCPVLSSGFEIETEMTLHTIDKRLALVEVPIDYRDRPVGSTSKLNTVSDGIRVLMTIVRFFRMYRPFAFYAVIGTFLLLLAGGFFIPVLIEYLQIGEVPRYPTLIVSGFAAIAGLLSFTCGTVLAAIKRQNDQVFEILAAR